MSVTKNYQLNCTLLEFQEREAEQAWRDPAFVDLPPVTYRKPETNAEMFAYSQAARSFNEFDFEDFLRGLSEWDK